VYNVIVLGATFAAAGLAAVYGDACMILEDRPQAGYEFINAIKFGTDYATQPQSEEAKKMQKLLEEKGAFAEGRVNLFPFGSLIYRQLTGKNVLLNVKTVSIRQVDAGFEVEVYGVSGYRTFKAKRIIDTTANRIKLSKKTLNLLMAELPPAGILPAEALEEAWGHPGQCVAKIPVAKDADYPQARQAVAAFLRQLPESCKMITFADCFDCQTEGAYPVERDGVVYLPSVGYANPVLAFDGGVLFGRGGEA